jgi:EpsI family protein
MSVRLRLVGVLLALLVPGLSLAAWSFVEGSSMQVPPSAMPPQMGAWSGGADEELDHKIFAILGPSSYVARTYEARGKTPIGLYVGFYSGRVGQSKAPHDPEVCYPAAGWETIASRSVEVPIPGGDTLHAQLLVAQQRQARQLVLYWFQPAARWPKGMLAEELMFLVDAVSGRPQYAYVRLVASVSEAASNSAVLADLIAFASELAWPVRALVSGGPSQTTRGGSKVQTLRGSPGSKVSES